MKDNNSGGGIAILVIALLIVAVAMANRILRKPPENTPSNSTRLVKLYIKVFWRAIIFIFAAITCWIFVPYSITSFRGGLLATFLGVGTTIFMADGFRRLTEHRRLKRTLGMLKYITIPYLEAQSGGMTDTMKQYNGTISIPQALLLLELVSNFDSISLDFDKSWLQLIHSQDFIDAIDNDDHFHKIADAEFEVHTFTKNLAAQSVRAKYLLTTSQLLISTNQAQFLVEVQGVRDTLQEGAKNLAKYSKELGKTINSFLLDNGVSYKN